MTPKSAQPVEEQPVEEETPQTEAEQLHAIVPDEMVTDDRPVISGIRCRVARLKTREHLALGRILTRTAQFVDWNALSFRSEDPARQSAEALSIMVTMLSHVPFAEDEVIKLFKAIVVPVESVSEDEFRIWFRAIDNPDVDELVQVVAIVLRQEKDNWAKIGRSLESVLPKGLVTAAKTAVTNPPTTTKTQD